MCEEKYFGDQKHPLRFVYKIKFEWVICKVDMSFYMDETVLQVSDRLIMILPCYVFGNVIYLVIIVMFIVIIVLHIVICSKCENVVLPKVGEQIKGKEEVFCSRCDCKYENRNTTIIKVPISSLTDFAVAMLFV